MSDNDDENIKVNFKKYYYWSLDGSTMLKNRVIEGGGFQKKIFHEWFYMGIILLSRVLNVKQHGFQTWNLFQDRMNGDNLLLVMFMSKNVFLNSAIIFC